MGAELRGRASGSGPGSGPGLGSFAALIGLVIAGEAAFILPFHVARFFRPTMLEVFSLSATQLGVLHSIYGVAALLSYFPSGLVADRVPARTLLCAGLMLTALGGLYFLTVPGFVGLAILFSFWGVSTILPLWGALIRATRRWGGPRGQGRAYGLLDGGRGLVAAAVASFGALALAALFPDDPATVAAEVRSAALLRVIAGYVAATGLAALLVFVLIPGGRGPAAQVPRTAAAIAEAKALRRQVLRTPALWAQAAIVFAAYVGYKGMDDVALFAVDAWGYDEVESARLVAWITWTRPLACVVAGLVSDRVRASTMLPFAFTLVAAGEVVLWLVPGDVGIAWFFAVDALTIAAAVFALRAVYFALFAEARIPMAATGAAIGAVSVVGFVPELFVNAAGGALVDAAPGGLGHQRFAGCLAAAALVGVVASLAFRRLARRS